LNGSYARTNLPNVVSTAAYNASNQLTRWGAASLMYDANGNMPGDGAHAYTWDARNHLKQIDAGTTGSLVYDPFGRRAQKVIAGTSTSFLYDGANAVQEIIGGSSTVNSLSGGVDEVFQRTEAAGALQTQYTFDAFGNTTVNGTATTNSFAYTGRELDAGNLYYYSARYYNPALERFISEDPIGFNGGDVNLYACTRNSPTNFTDPLGLESGTNFKILHDNLLMTPLPPMEPFPEGNDRLSPYLHYPFDPYH
jgi:RHS repeat-associated protein